VQRCRAAEEDAVRLRAEASDAHARLARTDRALQEEAAKSHPRACLAMSRDPSRDCLPSARLRPSPPPRRSPAARALSGARGSASRSRARAAAELQAEGERLRGEGEQERPAPEAGPFTLPGAPNRCEAHLAGRGGGRMRGSWRARARS